MKCCHYLLYYSQINYDAITARRDVSDAVMLEASPAVIDDGDRVQVHYCLDTAPVGKDSDIFIAAYSPSNVDVRLTAPISYKFIGDMKGVTPFDLVNMRDDYVFVLFEGGLAAPVELIRSNTVVFRNYNAPRAARLMHTHQSGFLPDVVKETSTVHLQRPLATVTPDMYTYPPCLSCFPVRSTATAMGATTR